MKAALSDEVEGVLCAEPDVVLDLSVRDCAAALGSAVGAGWGLCAKAGAARTTAKAAAVKVCFIIGVPPFRIE
jgi:hypothetical protein